MAKLLWGKVYYLDHFAGILKEEPGGRFVFAYDMSYLETDNPPIAHTLPKQVKPFISELGLHPFFDNLVAEGWLEKAQAHLLGKRVWNRFDLLLAFGMDCAGAVSIIDPEPVRWDKNRLDIRDSKEFAVLQSRASLSGIQPKLPLTYEKGKLRPTRVGEFSTHIAKFASATIPDILENEYLTTLACKILLPHEEVVELDLRSVLGDLVLVIKRFDRDETGQKRHFEEFTQLLGLLSYQKYEGTYRDMADFIAHTKGCIRVENYRLFKRILAGLLTGNTDMHLKNFGMRHTQAGLRLCPFYDLVSAAIYHPQYQQIALKIGGNDLPIGSLKAKTILTLGSEFGLNEKQIIQAVYDLKRRLNPAKDAVMNAKHGSLFIKQKIIQHMEKRWNGTFALIGTPSLKKPLKDATNNV